MKCCSVFTEFTIVSLCSRLCVYYFVDLTVFVLCASDSCQLIVSALQILFYITLDTNLGFPAPFLNSLEAECRTARLGEYLSRASSCHVKLNVLELSSTSTKQSTSHVLKSINILQAMGTCTNRLRRSAEDDSFSAIC